jgi:hypothetical protein
MSGAAEPAGVRAWSLASGGGRIAIGLGMLAAPDRGLRALGFGEVNEATKAVGRVAGIRDLVLGVLTLAALDDRDRLRATTLANAAADAGDTVAFAVALRAGERGAGSLGLAAALPAAMTGLWAAWRLG